MSEEISTRVPVDHYGLLGVPRNASTQTIRKAYRKQAKCVHPDASRRDSGGEFARLRAAYKILSDPEQRRLYDAATIFDAGRRSASHRRSAESVFRGNSGSPFQPNATAPIIQPFWSKHSGIIFNTVFSVFLGISFYASVRLGINIADESNWQAGLAFGFICFVLAAGASVLLTALLMGSNNR